MKAELASLRRELAEEARLSDDGRATAGLIADSPRAGGGLGGYIMSLKKENVKALTGGMSGEVFETMNMLVSYVMKGDAGAGTGVGEEQRVEVPMGALQQLCLWQLVLGYRLREEEATGEYKERAGR
ncbi:hypothetical protein TeGR_g13037 [Tetraparma gracilis]|uniref:Uncharacterized protein n=1 Tax=Tetraparma gracilis TaxID=2962635 RepID=A0ABQ6M488_9STRA|nr:hypothetical protein TeGR_g13037 [Tetraparma gracilis]